MSPVALLDVNVLVSLAWPNHVGHSAAREWFAEHAPSGWATTAVTESGFVRVSSNRRALPAASSPAIAIALLARLREFPGHRFWADKVELVTGPHLDPAMLTGHRQVTDAHLVALAKAHRGRLVTFDRGTRALAPAESDVILLDA